MSEPEELILEGAHLATRAARDVWQRYGAAPADQGTPLDRVRGRLELFLSALFRAPLAIAALQPNAPTTWLARLSSARRRTSAQPAVCGTDGRRVFLPGVIGGDPDEALATYRLFGVEQAARIVRGSWDAAARASNPFVRELFRIADGAAVDAWIATHAPGLTPALTKARAESLQRAATASRKAGSQKRLYELLRDVLATDAAGNVLALPVDASADDCLRWAVRTAADASDAGPAAVDAVHHWGQFLELQNGAASRSLTGDASPRSRPPRVVEMRRRPRVRTAAEDEDDERAGAWVIRADDPQESVEDPFGLNRPADRQHDADPEGLGDSLSDLSEVRVVRSPESAREVLRSGEASDVSSVAEDQVVRPGAVSYPEWDFRCAAYRQPGAVVRERDAPAGDLEWARAALARHAGLARHVRERFQRLRSRRVRLFRQMDGDDIDVGACVEAMADRRARVTPDGRLYSAQRPARRELAIAVLMDASASTDSWVTANRRIIDVEKEAMLVVAEALDALGDRYALFAFSGQGPERVDVVAMKRFARAAHVDVMSRVSALDSDGYTRLGAAVRHVTAGLCREDAGERLLLLLSDGKPNDVDVYETRYGIEDTRQAVAEARRQGVTVFCVTVDRSAPAYASHVFGSTGYALLHRAEQLPAVIVEVLRRLIRS